MVERSYESIKRENGILRGIVRLQATLIDELMENLPQEFQDLPGVKRARETSEKILRTLALLDNVDGN